MLFACCYLFAPIDSVFCNRLIAVIFPMLAGADPNMKFSLFVSTRSKRYTFILC